MARTARFVLPIPLGLVHALATDSTLTHYNGHLTSFSALLARALISRARSLLGAVSCLALSRPQRDGTTGPGPPRARPLA